MLLSRVKVKVSISLLRWDCPQEKKSKTEETPKITSDNISGIDVAASAWRDESLLISACPGLFCLFTSFSHHNLNINWIKRRSCAWDFNPRLQDGRCRRIRWAISGYLGSAERFFKNHFHPNGLTGVTNAHGPSSQPKACRSSACSLTTATGSNQA